ncbi:MAG: DNA gyrase inhibitor YacG [Nitrospirae bacterium]|nr:DNA gyrase inhibitor YacG [Nitrospirota bacterium]
MKVKCPTCKQWTEWRDNPFRPFCSERCKLIDLGAWASDAYKIEGKLNDEGSRIPSEKENGDG